MTEVLEREDATLPNEDGWRVFYKVERNDGEVVTVEVQCSGSAEAVAQAREDDEALAYISDRGSLAAVKYAEHAQSPAQRGNVMVRLWVDSLNGGLRHDVDYERGP